MRIKKSFVPLCMTERLTNDLLLEPGEIYPISLGKRKKQVVIEEARERFMGSTAMVGSPLAKILGLPEPTRLTVKKEKNLLRLGPLVGIMSAPFKSDRGSFGAQDRFFRSLIKAMKAMNGAAYVFTPSDVDIQRKLINGYYLDGDMESSWKRHWFPLPDVCYNRYVRTPSMARSRDSIGLLNKFGVVSFNTAVGNKWAVYKRLDKIPRIIQHLPETRLLNSPEVLADLLRKYKGVYVKPVNGSKGRDIKRITRMAGAYVIRSNGRGRGIRAGSLREAYAHIRSGNVNEMMIAQQAIMMTTGLQHFDIRVMVQKDRQNQWAATGMAARVGGNGQVTTNLHTGGHAEKPEVILTSRGMGEAQVAGIIREIKDLALIIGHQLDKYSRALGDLGMDFIVDSKGKVWFLEVNPKPGRHSFSIIDHEVRKDVVAKPMEYACFLSGF